MRELRLGLDWSQGGHETGHKAGAVETDKHPLAVHGGLVAPRRKEHPCWTAAKLARPEQRSMGIETKQADARLETR